MRHLVWLLAEAKCGASWLESLVWPSTTPFISLSFLPACSAWVEVTLHHLQGLSHYPFFNIMSAKGCFTASLKGLSCGFEQDMGFCCCCCEGQFGASSDLAGLPELVEGCAMAGEGMASPKGEETPASLFPLS